jgi:uncharacterized protein (DUF433 family)
MYTVPDIAHILRIPVAKVNRWVKEYWDKRFSKSFGQTYSWKSGSSRAVNFHTLIELCICFKLSEDGVSTKAIIEAHQALSEIFNTSHPFASAEILPKISSDSKKIYFKENDKIIYSLDVHRQFNVEFVQLFFKNIEFNENSIAQRLWPLGKDRHIVVDPSHQFGQPVVENTNIYPETLYGLFKAGEPINFIAHIYDISEKDVSDAIEFCQAA